MLNLYGDQKLMVQQNHGADIAQQRCDDLDQTCLNFVRTFEPVAGRKPRILDLACGAGGQTARIAQLGAEVIGFDFPNIRSSFDTHMTQVAKSASWREPGFFGGDMRTIPEWWISLHYQEFDAITCQRAIHYLPYNQAQELLSRLRTMLRPDGRLFLSASGIHSELGEGYEQHGVLLSQRFGTLAPVMQEAHGIAQPVCLYSEEDLAQLAYSSGWAVERIYSSAFGNIKSILRISQDAS